MKKLIDLYHTHTGKVSDKWALYLHEYDRLFSPYRDLPISVLEIGVQNGGSLEIWSQYFPNAKKIVGSDINLDCAKLQFGDPRIKVIVGDATTEETKQKILKHSDYFDFIIEDGSHTSGDIVKSFALYFSLLQEGGIFVVEDLHCSYWQDYQGGIFHPYSSINFFKQLADVLNHEHWGSDQSSRQLLSGFEKEYQITLDEDLLSKVHSIEFVNSICVIKKNKAALNKLSSRIISGQVEIVVSGHLGINNSLAAPPLQTSNFWSNLKASPAEEYQDMLNQINDTKEKLSREQAEKESLREVISAIYRSTSWKLTVPVRFIGHMLLRIKVIFKALPYAKIMCGGYIGLFKYAYKTYKKEGLTGIRRRIAFSASPSFKSPVSDYIETNHNDYTEWVRRYDTITDVDREKITALISRIATKPLISILMPVYNPPLSMLKEAIESVQKQLYPNWELCIADDASSDKAVHKLLNEYAKEDLRIKVVFRKENGHISAASNSALELSKGEYVALLDNDDLLPEQALFCIAQTIQKHPDAGLIYSDEDKIDQTGRRYDPYFKSDWNPDLFLSHNIISHLGVYKADLVKKLGGFRAGCEGSQDYDLALRCTEQLAPHQIVHIPRVLYHWRSHPGSTALAGSEKNYALLAGERALNDHFDRVNVSAKAELLHFGMYRAHYAIPQLAPLVSLIIPTRNGLNLIKQCVKSILDKTTFSNFEIIIVDNNSDDPKTLEYFASIVSDNRIRVLRDERPFNYSALNNAAVPHARGDYLGLINNDIEVITPQWLNEMMSLAIQPGVGAVGARLWYPNDTLQHGGCITGILGVAAHAHRHLPKEGFGYFARAQLIQTLSVVTAACLVVKKSVFQQVGGLDETNLKVAFNDIDFCLRVRDAGYRNIWTPYAELYHHESATRGLEDTPEKQLRFRDEILYMQKRWADTLANDPAYSPNLTLDREDFSLAWPPRVQLLGD
jgi:glycosyltransferase involved in cell wall biosynthesis/23S rRNA U2552 (ribose-2'-O)-methylase RlmE/FtsJ